MDKVFFPYDIPRPEQEEIIAELIETLRRKKSCVFEAPSGVGKTIAVLSVVVPYAMDHGLKVFYTCRTHTQMSRVIDELRVMEKKGFKAYGVMIRGRGEMCFIDFVRKLPYRQMLRLCEQLRAGGRCPYYLRLKEIISEGGMPIGKGIYHSEDILHIAKKIKVCPYGLALEIAKKANVITLSYLYLFDRDLRNIILRALNVDLDKALVIVDEAHNVIDVALEVESLKLSNKCIEDSIRSLRKLRLRAVNAKEYDVRRVKYVLSKGLRVIKKILDERGTTQERIYPAYEFVRDFELATNESLLVFVDWLSEYLDMISKRRLIHNLMNLELLKEFLEKLIDTQGDERFVHIIERGREGVEYSISCIDPQIALKPLIEEAYITIHMSATLSPIHDYMEIVGLKRGRAFSVKPSYHGRVRGFIITEISTAYEKRNMQMYSKIANAISDLVNSIEGNIAVFVPSYEVLYNIVGRLEIKKDTFIEEKGESTTSLEEKIRRFKSMWSRGGGVLIGVLGGRMCEGVDYPGKELEVVIIVGVPYPEPNARLYAQRRYYSMKYGFEKSFEYTAVIPAMRKVNQAVGRLVRKPNDYGVVILMDERYTRLRRYLVSWMKVVGEIPCSELNTMINIVKNHLTELRQSLLP